MNREGLPEYTPETVTEQSIREGLEAVLFDQLGVNITQITQGTPKVVVKTGAIAEAVLASPVIRRIQAEAWSEGAAWAAVECGTIDHETQQFEAPGDNPYIEQNSEGNET